MTINPPSLPNTNISADAFVQDNAALAVGVIAAEQSAASLQTVGNLSSLLSAQLGSSLAALDTASELRSARNDLQEQEASESESIAQSLRGSIESGDAPADADRINGFLSERGLPTISVEVDDDGVLTDESIESLEAAAGSLEQYAADTREDLSNASDEAINNRIQNNPELQDAISRAQEGVRSSRDVDSVESYDNLVQDVYDFAADGRERATQLLDELARAGAQAINASNQTDQATNNVSQVLAQFSAVLNTNLQISEQQLLQDIQALEQSVTALQGELAADLRFDDFERLGTLIDRVNTTADRLRENFTALLSTVRPPDQVVSERRANLESLPTFPERDPDRDFSEERPVRTVRDPTRFV